MGSQRENLTVAQLEARRENAKKSTGPRTLEGKKRVSQNARKHGLYSNASFFWDAAIALGEDPRDFERLLKGLVLARRPADALEMVLVEDIALLIWKKARLDRAETAVQVRNLQMHDLERRKQLIQVGREISDTLHSEVREKGLRRTLDAPGKFEQVLSILDVLVQMVEKNEFSPSMQEFLRALYGKEPTLRGAGLYNIAGHDCAYIRRYLGAVPIAGFFTGFEIGALAEHTTVLQYSGVLALISGRKT